MERGVLNFAKGQLHVSNCLPFLISELTKFQLQCGKQFTCDIDQ